MCGHRINNREEMLMPALANGLILPHNGLMVARFHKGGRVSLKLFPIVLHWRLMDLASIYPGFLTLGWLS